MLAYRPRPTDVVVVEPALNDVRHRGTAGLRRYRRSLGDMLSHLSQAARPGDVLVLVDPPIVAWRRYAPYDHGSRALRAYREATRRVAAASTSGRSTSAGAGTPPTTSPATRSTRTTPGPSAAPTRSSGPWLRRLDLDAAHAGRGRSRRQRGLVQIMCSAVPPMT
ncbi:MAG: hypothetical protein ACR2NB_04530 [Solirubrobacteraceae bacterium]